jgi:hypothetical protein
MIVDRSHQRQAIATSWNEPTRSHVELGQSSGPPRLFVHETYHVRCRLVLGKYRPISWHEKRSRYQGNGGTGGGGGSSGGSSGGITAAAAAIDEEEKRWRDDAGEEEEVDRDEDPEAGAAVLERRGGDPEASIGRSRGGWLILSGRPLSSSFEEGALEGRAANASRREIGWEARTTERDGRRRDFQNTTLPTNNGTKTYNTIRSHPPRRRLFGVFCGQSSLTKVRSEFPFRTLRLKLLLTSQYGAVK